MSMLRNRGRQISLILSPLKQSRKYYALASSPFTTRQNWYNTCSDRLFNSCVELLFGKSWKLTRKFRIPEKKLDSLSNKPRWTDLGMLEVPFHHTTVTLTHHVRLSIRLNNVKVPEMKLKHEKNNGGKVTCVMVVRHRRCKVLLESKRRCNSLGNRT